MRKYEIIKGWKFPCVKVSWIRDECKYTELPNSTLGGLYPTKKEILIYKKVFGGCPCGKNCKPVKCEIIMLEIDNDKI